MRNKRGGIRISLPKTRRSKYKMLDVNAKLLKLKTVRNFLEVGSMLHMLANLGTRCPRLLPKYGQGLANCLARSTMPAI